MLTSGTWAAAAPADSSAAPAAAKPAAKPAAAKPAAAKPAAAKPAAAKPAESLEDTGKRETEVYGERLTGIEQEVNTLKDRVFRSKARLAVLRDTVLRGVKAGSRLELRHRNIMGSGFRLVKIVVLLDGAQVFIREDDTGSLDQLDEFAIYDGNVIPGPHRVDIELTYRGNGYGVFNYLRDYTFVAPASHDFSAPKDGVMKLVSVGFEKGNLTTEMRDRPAIEWQTIANGSSAKPQRVSPARGKPAASAAAETEKPAAANGS